MRILARISIGCGAFLLGGAMVVAAVELVGPTPWVLAGFGALLIVAGAGWLAHARAASTARQRRLQHDVVGAVRGREGPYRDQDARQALRGMGNGED